MTTIRITLRNEEEVIHGGPAVIGQSVTCLDHNLDKKCQSNLCLTTQGLITWKVAALGIKVWPDSQTSNCGVYDHSSFSDPSDIFVMIEIVFIPPSFYMEVTFKDI